MKYPLRSAAIAASICASSLLASQPAPAADPPPDTSSSNATEGNATPKVEGPTKAAPKKTTTKAHERTTQKAKQEKAKAKGEVKAKAEGVTEQAHESAQEANKTIVGETTQNENERKAREKRDREAKEDADAKRAGEKVGRATTTAATSVVDAGQDVTRALDQPGGYSPLVVTWNPLGAVVGGRVSFNIEYAPVTHHVLIVSPHFANPSQEVLSTGGTTQTNRFTGGGGEIGYRYYTGSRGPNGLFIGPSVIGGVYNADVPGPDRVFTNIGVAGDVGFQYLAWDHLALGAGVGVEYLHVSRDFGDLSAGPSTIASSGLKPRLLAQAGYAF